MRVVVINGIVITDCEPIVNSSIRQIIERQAPQTTAEWCACFILGYEAAHCAFGMKIIRSMMN